MPDGVWYRPPRCEWARGEGSAEIGLRCSSETFTRLDGAGIDLPLRASFKSEASLMSFMLDLIHIPFVGGLCSDNVNSSLNHRNVHCSMLFIFLLT